MARHDDCDFALLDFAAGVLRPLHTAIRGHRLATHSRLLGSNCPRCPLLRSRWPEPLSPNGNRDAGYRRYRHIFRALRNYVKGIAKPKFPKGAPFPPASLAL